MDALVQSEPDSVQSTSNQASKTVAGVTANWRPLLEHFRGGRVTRYKALRSCRLPLLIDGGTDKVGTSIGMGDAVLIGLVLICSSVRRLGFACLEGKKPLHD